MRLHFENTVFLVFIHNYRYIATVHAKTLLLVRNMKSDIFFMLDVIR